MEPCITDRADSWTVSIVASGAVRRTFRAESTPHAQPTPTQTIKTNAMSLHSKRRPAPKHPEELHTLECSVFWHNRHSQPQRLAAAQLMFVASPLHRLLGAAGDFE